MSKRIKWNWGTKLVIAIVLFMCFIFVLVYMSSINTIDLVERDYYPKGLQYQNRIEEINNARIFRDDFNMTRENEYMVFSVPEIDPDSGSIIFFRPSNQLLDFASKIQPDSTGRMYFPLDAFQTGLYVMKIHWYQNAEGYYIEQKFFVN